MFPSSHYISSFDVLINVTSIKPVRITAEMFLGDHLSLVWPHFVVMHSLIIYFEKVYIYCGECHEWHVSDAAVIIASEMMHDDIKIHVAQHNNTQWRPSANILFYM